VRMRSLVLALGIAQLAATLCAGAELSSSEEYALAIHATLNPEHGGQIFHGKCEMCHGARGEGYPSGPAAAFPVTGGQHFRVLVLALVRFRHGHSSTHRMQYFAGADRLGGAQELADVAAYMAVLRPASASGVGAGLSLDEGARVYLRNCESCHGPTGQGDAAKPVPRLAGQHYRYLLRKFNAPADAHRADDPHTRRMQPLSASDRDAMADYLSRLAPSFAHAQ
jgi:cytochrome c553